MEGLRDCSRAGGGGGELGRGDGSRKGAGDGFIEAATGTTGGEEVAFTVDRGWEGKGFACGGTLEDLGGGGGTAAVGRGLDGS